MTDLLPGATQLAAQGKQIKSPGQTDNMPRAFACFAPVYDYACIYFTLLGYTFCFTLHLIDTFPVSLYMLIRFFLIK